MVELAAMFGAHFDSFTLHEIVDVFTFERHLANVCNAFIFEDNIEQN